MDGLITHNIAHTREKQVHLGCPTMVFHKVVQLFIYTWENIVHLAHHEGTFSKLL